MSIYNTAVGLYRYIAKTMPMNAPGGLLAQDYEAVTIYILVQNNMVKNETPVTTGQLDNIKLR
jgi:hypothetical protein